MRRLLFLPLLSLLACATSAPTTASAPARAGTATPAAPPRPQFVPTGTAQRVVLMTFDGLGADELTRQTQLPAFEHLARAGAVARVIPVNPTLTAPTHASILTGADPQVHGVVANRFHVTGTPMEQTAHGLNVEIDVETIVDAAKRHGKRVGIVPFPGMDATTPRRTADFGLVWTPALVPGRIVKLTRNDFKRDEWVPPTWSSRPQRRTSFSPIMRSRVEWTASRSLRIDVDVVAFDTTDDRRTNYDLYVIERGGEHELPIDARGWFAISRDHHGSWSKMLSTTPNLDVTLYWGPISRTRAYPEAYRAMLDTEAGFWPGLPDEQSDIDPNTFAEQIERLSAFLTRAQTLTIQRMPFDLLLAYQPVIDQAGHNFLGYDDSVIRRAYVAADRAAAAVGGELDVNRDAFLVTGDHGLVPVDRVVHMNRLLADHGFAPHWRAYASLSVAHIYRFSGKDDSDALVKMLTSSGFFERVEKKSATSHADSGDIVAIAFPSIALSPSDESPVVGEPDSYGQHGALNTHRELHTVLFASGAGVPRGELGELAQTQIARFVAGLLGVPWSGH